MSVWHTKEKGKPIVSMHEAEWREHMARIDRLTLALSESEERGEGWKAEAMAARDMHRSNVTLGARDGTATFRKWHDARALNDQSEPQPPQTQTQETKP